MSFVIAEPDFVAAAAGQLAGVRSSIGAAAHAAAAPTTSIAEAAADEISAAISRLFGTYGQEFQAVNAQAAAFHAEFVRLLNGSAAAYLSADIANAEQALLGGAVGFPTAAPTDPLGGLLGGILGGSGTTGLLDSIGATTGGLGTLLGGSGGILGPLFFGGTGGLLGPLVGGNGLLTGLVGGGPLAPIFDSAGQQLGLLASGFLNGTGGAALTSALQSLTGPIGTIPVIGDLGRTLLPGLFPSAVTAPVYPAGSAWQQLFTNTSNNLSALNTAFGQDPFPVLRQVLANQQGYAIQIGQEFSFLAQNPALWAEATLKNLATANPAQALQTALSDQAKYANTVVSSLSRFGTDVQAGLGQFQTSMQAVSQDIAAGDYNGAVQDGTAAFLNLFITGFDTSNLNNIKVLGPAADLFPLFAIPGQEAQTFANLIPPGSVPNKMMQNVANMLNAFADTSISTTIGGTIIPPALQLDANFGLPLSVLFSVLGAPVAGLDGFATAGTVIGNGIATGNIGMIAGGLFDSPAYVLDGLLNGTTLVDLTMNAQLLPGISLPVVMHLPFNGILVPPQHVTATVPLDILGIHIPINLTLGGTPFAGLANTLLVYTPRHLADAITPA